MKVTSVAFACDGLNAKGVTKTSEMINTETTLNTVALACANLEFKFNLLRKLLSILKNCCVDLLRLIYPVQKYIKILKSLMSILLSALQSIVFGGLALPLQNNKMEKSIKLTRLSLL